MLTYSVISTAGCNSSSKALLLIGVSSWYKNAAGKVINNWCGTADEYGKLTAELNLEDYIEYEHADALTR